MLVKESRVNPPLYNLDVQSDNGLNEFGFFDQQIANQVAKALAHAVKVCGGDAEALTENEVPAPKVSPDASHTSPYDEQLKNAIALWKNNQVLEASRAAAALIQMNSNRWEAYGLAGAIEKAQNRLPEAKAAYERALTLAPGSIRPQIAQAIQQIEAEQQKP